MDRKVNSLKFCPKIGCAESFCDEISLQEHLITGNHTNQPVPKSMMDKARYLYINKMKVTSPSSSIPNLSSCSSVTDVEEEQNLTHSTGWALPKRKVFRYSSKQKRLLMKMFLAGEECGKKMSPEQVHQQLRSQLKPSEYVTSQQIRSLFSRQV